MKTILMALLAAICATASLRAVSTDYTPCAWEKQIVAACLVLEAANQGDQGMRGVASVILNRANGERSKLLSVVKRPYAFTSLNAVTNGRTGSRGFADHVQRASRDRHWGAALKIVEELYSRNWKDNTFGADHYVRKDLKPSWTRKMAVTTVIGSHVFYTSYQ